MGYYATVKGEQGIEVTADEIKAAYAEGRCLLAHSYGPSKTLTTLEIDGVERDTRGQTVQMSEAVWTQHPDNVAKCLQAAHA